MASARLARDRAPEAERTLSAARPRAGARRQAISPTAMTAAPKAAGTTVIPKGAGPEKIPSRNPTPPTISAAV
ncbi:MAG: hypothetical protein ACXWZ3_12280 [Solirubrobacterales bacterium]